MNTYDVFQFLAAFSAFVLCIGCIGAWWFYRGLR